MAFTRTHNGKIILTAFIGIQIPILALLYYLWLSKAVFGENITLISNFDINLTLIVILLIDVLGTTIFLYILNYLLTPIAFETKIIEQYLHKNQLNLSHLPQNYQADINTLIADKNGTSSKLQDIIYYLVYYDSLTGLPNRNLFQNFVEQAIYQTQAEQKLALILIDLDSLKSIDSTLGRQVGDLLLTKVAQRLSTYLATGDILARFGENELAILRTGITNSDCLVALSNRILCSLSQPFSLYESEVHCDAKLGITIYPFDGVTVEQLLQNADMAIYQTKQQKLNTYQFFSPSISNQLKRTLDIKENLRYALVNQEFSLYYQPRIHIATGCIAGVEALLRWHSPQLGWVSPDEFITIAEETNLIIPIGTWILQEACRQNKLWQEANLEPYKVSVNLSACQFKQENLVEIIDTILTNTGLSTDYLELEITESILFEDIEQAILTLTKLRRKGVSIALDDFGTGYSSLSYLNRLPVDTLKIDRSFVTNIVSNSDDAAISKAILALAQSLELNVTAEGVETRAQLKYLHEQGCNEAQGYYFSRPLPGEDLQDLLENLENLTLVV